MPGVVRRWQVTQASVLAANASTGTGFRLNGGRPPDRQHDQRQTQHHDHGDQTNHEQTGRLEDIFRLLFTHLLPPISIIRVNRD